MIDENIEKYTKKKTDYTVYRPLQIINSYGPYNTIIKHLVVIFYFNHETRQRTKWIVRQLKTTLPKISVKFMVK